jgi:hypothetical protein
MFYIVWIEENTAFDPNNQMYFEKRILHLEIKQQEGGFATAHVTLPSVTQTLVGAGNLLWGLIILKLDDKSTILFRGRVVLAPLRLAQSTVTLQLIAQPNNSSEQLQKLHTALRKTALWDPLFYNAQTHDNPSTGLEADASLYEWCRVTGQATRCSIINAPKELKLGGTVLDRPIFMYLNPQVHENIEVTLHAQWLQYASGTIDLGPSLVESNPYQQIETFTGEHFAKHQWPKSGHSLGQNSGYYVVDSGLMPMTTPLSAPLPLVTASASDSSKTLPVYAQCQYFYPKLLTAWRYQCSRHEYVVFSLKQQLQNLSSTSSKSTKKLHLTLADLTNLSPSEFQPHQPSFFTTARGHSAIAHALDIARAHLVASARAITIYLQIPLASALDISTQHMLSFQHPELPYGKARGKVIRYHLVMNGATGEQVAHVWIGACIGHPDLHNASSPTTEPAYAHDNALSPEAQEVSNYPLQSPQGLVFHRPTPAENSSSIPGVIDYPYALRAQDFIEKIAWHNTGSEQASRFAENILSPVPLKLDTFLRQHPTTLQVRLRPLHAQSSAISHIKVSIASSVPIPCHINFRNKS